MRGSNPEKYEVFCEQYNSKYLGLCLNISVRNDNSSPNSNFINRFILSVYITQIRREKQNLNPIRTVNEIMN